MLESLAPHLDLPVAPRRTLSTRAARGSRELIDVNRATAKELEALPGIGPALAGRIITSREADGPFRTVEELQRVAGIGPALLERLRPLVRVAR
jgi:competence protein ComEA